MKKINLLLLPLIGLSVFNLTSCDQGKTIRISASEVPHAKILRECISPILEEKGYTLTIKTLNWSIQNDALNSGEYDANYFQHQPFLEAYEHADKLAVAAKIHYEKLCMYSSSKDENKKLDNGESIVIVNDNTNIERALKLLEANNILTINESNYTNGEFKNFSVTDPTSCVTFKDGYTNCRLVCIAEQHLCTALADYNFGVIPGNTALLGLGDNFKDTIVYSEEVNEETLDRLSNVIAVRKADIQSEKTKALVEAFADERVGKYIKDTFGESVLYTFKNKLPEQK